MKASGPALDKLITLAAEKGSHRCLEAMFRMDEFKNRPIRSPSLAAATENGHATCLNILLKQGTNMTTRLHMVAFRAAELGQADCLDIVLSFLTPKTYRSDEIMQVAAEEGHSDCVRRLLPFYHCKDDASHALQLACENRHLECVELLLPVSKPLAVWKHCLSLLMEDEGNDWGNIANPLELLAPHVDEGLVEKAIQKLRKLPHNHQAMTTSAVLEKHLLVASGIGDVSTRKKAARPRI